MSALGQRQSLSNGTGEVEKLLRTSIASNSYLGHPTLIKQILRISTTARVLSWFSDFSNGTGDGGVVINSNKRGIQYDFYLCLNRKAIWGILS